MRKVISERPSVSDTVKERIDKSLAEFRDYFAGRTDKRPEIDEIAYKAYKKALLEEFHSKCAFCDRSVLGQLEGDVEHIRPKNRVADENGRLVTSKSNPDQPHPGYWWLAYDWRNLVIACKECNTRYKRDKFVVDGDYAEDEGMTDVALLVHHHEDDTDPAENFDMNLVTGEFVAINRKGEVTEKILKLNRENLCAGRLTALVSATALPSAASDPLKDPLMREAALREISAHHTGSAEHSTFCVKRLTELEESSESAMATIRNLREELHRRAEERRRQSQGAANAGGDAVPSRD
jgi:hypothetical protein